MVKNNQDSQIQNKLRPYNFMQHVFFWKKSIWCTMGSGAKPPEALEFSRIFVLKVTLHLLLTVSYTENGEYRPH